MSKVYTIIILFFFSIKALAQHSELISPQICYASDKDSFTRLLRESQNHKLRTTSSNIEVTYTDFPDAAKSAFEMAVGIWAVALNSSVDIRVNATWERQSGNTLGFSGATRIFRNMKNAPYKDVWYVGPLAEAISGKDLNDGDFDINITLNSAINWSYNTNGELNSGEYDLVTVVLHEMAHGLGFSSSFKLINNDSEGQWGQSGFPYIYDLFLENLNGQELVDHEIFFNPSEELQKQVISNSIYFQVSNEQFANDFPKIYSPNPFKAGGSISHLDEGKYPPGSTHSLMSPNIRAAEVNHVPGDLILSILNQIGWPVNNLVGATLLSEGAEKVPKILVYPNPTTRQVAVAMPIELRSKETQVSLFDSSGKQVYHVKRDSKQEPTFYFNLEAFSSGLYLLKIETEKGKTLKKLIKK